MDAVPASGLGARVPACPGWTAYDLVVHLGNIHGWAATILETRRYTAVLEDRPRSRRGAAVAQWYAGKAEDLLAVLRSVPAGEACWTFSAHDRTAGFWRRRQCHETLVHLVDLDRASGRATQIDPALAADGVAEVLEVFLPRMHARGRRAELTGPVAVHLTDTGTAWTLTPQVDGPPVVTSGGDSVDVVSATAATMLQVLWKRLPPGAEGVQVLGDAGRVGAFLRSPLTP